MRGGLVVGVVLVGLAAACGGGDGEPSDPSQLISGSITGDFDGEAFQADYGVLFYNDVRAEGSVLFGTSPIRCAQDYLEVPGIYVEFPFFGEITDGGSAGGSHTFARVTETMNPESYTFPNGFVGFDVLTETSLAGNASGGGSDLDQEHFYSMEGSFEIMRCPM